MKIKLKYLEELEYRNLQVSDLTEDAQNGVEQLNALLESYEQAVAEKKPTEAIEKKIASQDKWITYEIYDMDEEEGEENELETNDPVGVECEAEMAALFEAGTTELTADEVKKSAPQCYAVIFATYEKDGKNGIETTHYSLIESDPEKFKLSKK